MFKHLAIFLGALALLLSLPLKAKEDFYDLEQTNPAFEKFKKYGNGFPARYALERANKKKEVEKYKDLETEKDYQEFVKLMDEVMEHSNKAIEDASNFQERYKSEKSGKRVEEYREQEKENNYQAFKRKMQFTTRALESIPPS